MIYAQFYNRLADGILLEACGDRAVIILDGRYTNQNNAVIAEAAGAKRGYAAYSIHKGESFTRSVKISGPYTVYADKPDTTAASAAHGA